MEITEMQHCDLPKRVPFNLFLSASVRQGRYTRDKKDISWNNKQDCDIFCDKYREHMKSAEAGNLFLYTKLNPPEMLRPF